MPLPGGRGGRGLPSQLFAPTGFRCRPSAVTAVEASRCRRHHIEPFRCECYARDDERCRGFCASRPAGYAARRPATPLVAPRPGAVGRTRALPAQVWPNCLRSGRDGDVAAVRMGDAGKPAGAVLSLRNSVAAGAEVGLFTGAAGGHALEPSKASGDLRNNTHSGRHPPEDESIWLVLRSICQALSGSRRAA